MERRGLAADLYPWRRPWADLRLTVLGWGGLAANEPSGWAWLRARR
jgi:hypothetical protein